MRLYIDLTPNTQTVDFHYQQKLVGAFHKWLGPNTKHDELSLYSLAWLTGGKMYKGGLTFPEGAGWFISSPDRTLIKAVVDGVFADPDIAYGMKVKSLTMRETPDFGNEYRFLLNSPILVKRKEEGKENPTHYIYEQKEADQIMTEILKLKLQKGGLEGKEVTATFDRSYRNAKTKLVYFGKTNDNKGIGNRASLCPVILKGDPEAISFAWEVGVGNSTGIGFGALV